MPRMINGKGDEVINPDLLTIAATDDVKLHESMVLDDVHARYMYRMMTYAKTWENRPHARWFHLSRND